MPGHNWGFYIDIIAKHSNRTHACLMIYIRYFKCFKLFYNHKVMCFRLMHYLVTGMMKP